MTTFARRSISPAQVRLVKLAQRAAKVQEADYRTVLRTAGGGVESSKDLDQAGFERVMAYFECLGFVDSVHGEGHWSARWERRGVVASERQVRLILRLAEDSRYELPALCLRFSGQQSSRPEGLTPRQAYALIEMLKASAARETDGPGQCGPPRLRPPSRPAHPPRDRHIPVDDDEVPF